MKKLASNGTQITVQNYIQTECSSTKACKGSGVERDAFLVCPSFGSPLISVPQDQSQGLRGGHPFSLFCGESRCHLSASAAQLWVGHVLSLQEVINTELPGC